MLRTSRNRVLALGVVTSLLLLTRVHSAGAADQPAHILDLHWDLQGDATSITLKLSAPVRYRTSTSGTSIAVDLWTVADSGDRAVTPDRGIASSLNVRQMTPDVARLGITLREPGHFKVYLRDDRVNWFFDLGYGGEANFVVKCNPSFRGTYVLPPVSVEPMYSPDYYARIAGGDVIVR